MLRCSVCGEEINNDENSCPSCGATIANKSDSSKLSADKITESPKSSNAKIISTKAGKNNNLKESSEKSNSISPTKLFYLVLALVLVGAVLIYSSGVFDSTPNSFSSSQTDLSNPHSGVDLKNLEQINSLQAYIEKNPNDKETLLQLAHLYNDSGFKPKAIERYTQYLKLDPKNTDVLVDMGVCYFETGKSDSAITSMERALKINPRHQIANLNLGVVNMASGNTEKAIGYWKKAIEIDPTNEIGKRAKELITTH